MVFNISATLITADSTADNGFDLYVINATANNVTLNIGVEGQGKVYFFKRQDASGNTVTIQPTDGSLINGQTNATMSAGSILKLIKFGTSWISFL